MIKVVIPEGIPSLNKGEAAILGGYLEILSLCGQVEITIFSPDSWFQDDLRNYGNMVKLVGGTNIHGQGLDGADKPAERSRLQSHLTVLRLLAFAMLSRIAGKLAKYVVRDKLFRSILNADIIVAAHDGLMSPIQSHIVRAGRIMGKPVVLLGGGTGSTAQIGHRKRKQLKYAVDNSICCVVRDRESYENLQFCQINGKYMRLAPDPAVLLPPCDDVRVNHILDLEKISLSERQNICSVITCEGGIVASDSYAAIKNPDIKRQYRVKMWSELLSHLLKTTDAYVIFLPHCIGPYPANDDRHIARDIYKTLDCYKDRIKCIEKEYTAGELKGIMKNCQLVLSERAHAAIGAFSAGTPCVGFTVDKDRRMHSIINGMFGRPVCNLDDPQITQLKELITSEWNNRQQTSIVMAEHVKMILEQAHTMAKWVHDRIKESLSKS